MIDELISVIIPAYNAEQYLENCVDSVLNQTYKNLEIILVDDGSKDKTGLIAEEYKGKYPCIIRVVHTDNQGVTRARFEGIKRSKGEWIGFVDADDVIEPDMYEKLYRNAVYYKADISHCGYKTIVNDGERVYEFYNTGRLSKQNNKEGVYDLLAGVFEPTLCTKLFRKKYLVQVMLDGVVDETICYNEDLLINYYLFSLVPFSIFEDFCGYHYMARRGSATRKGFQEKKLNDPVKVNKQILDNVSDDLKNLAWKNYLECCLWAYIEFYRHKDFASSNEYKLVLDTNRDKWPLLSRNNKLKLRILMISPKLFDYLYRVYEKRFQKIKY